MNKFEFQLEQDRIARQAQRNTVQQRSEHALRQQQRELDNLAAEHAAIAAERAALENSRKPSEDRPVRLVVATSQSEALEAELKSLREQHAEHFKRVADQVRGVAETVAKRPRKIRAPSGKIYSIED